MIVVNDQESEVLVMKGQKIKEIISILMESPLYFGFTLRERLELIHRLTVITV